MSHLRTYSNKFQTIFLCLIFLISLQLPAQTDKKKQLENDRAKIQKEIEYTDKLLSETKKQKETTLSQIALYRNKIKLREEKISTINSEISYLDVKIITNTQEINNLNQKLKALKDEYAKMVYYAYLNRNAYNRLMFIFASEDFNQAYRRLKYLQQYEEYRKQQAELIMKSTTELTYLNNQLKLQKGEKVTLIVSQETEKKTLVDDTNKKSKIAEELRKKEGDLKKKLKEKKAQKSSIDTKIQAIIQEEIRKAKAAKAAEKPVADKTKSTTGTTSKTTTSTTKTTPKSTAITATPAADIEMSASFSGNQGKLPWPTDRGVVSIHFGNNILEEYNNAGYESNGIDILTTQNAEAKVVFNGTVRSVFNVSGRWAVLVKHGDYFTVYANLKEVYVKTGDAVKTKQILGKVYTDVEDNSSELHFEIWRGEQKLNPESWLVRRK